MPEEPTTNRIPSPQERIDLAAQAAYQRSNDIPVASFRVDTSLPLNNRLVIAAENIALTNTRILTNLGQMKTMFAQFTRDSEKVNQFRDETVQRSRVPGAGPSIVPESLTDVERIRALGRVRQLDEQLPTDLAPERISRLRARRLEQMGVGVREGDALRVGEERYAGEQLSQAVARARGQIKEPLEDNVERLASRIEQTAIRGSLESRTRATMQERLQARGLETWDFLNPARFLHTIGGMISGHHIPAGGGGRMPVTMPTTVPGSVAGTAAEEAGAAGGLARAAGPLERLMAGGALAGTLARVGLGMIPGVGQIALAAMTLPALAHHIPGLNRLLNTRQSIIGLETSGALTGEGRGAGLAAIREARDLRGGIVGSTFHGLLHPFDPITNQIATEIVNSVRTQGVTGTQGREIQRQVASLYRDLRLPIDQTTQLLVDAVRQGGESLQQITKEMHGFDDAAHQLQMNINDYATAIGATAQSLREQGAGSLATTFAQSILASLPRSLRNEAGTQMLQQGVQQAAPYIMARTGLMPWQLGTPQALPRQYSAYEDILRQQFGMAQGRTMQERANYASMYLPAFQGMNPLQVRQLMDRIVSGLGPGSIAALDQARHDYSRQVAQIGHPRSRMRISELLHRGFAFAAEHGVTEKELLDLQDKYYSDQKDRMVRLSTPFLDTKNLPMRDIEALRRRTIHALGGTLTDAQRRELEKHVADRKFSFDKALQRYERGRGRLGSGSSITQDGITITLKGKAAKLLELNAPNREQAYRGQTQMNSAFPTENSRLDTGF